MSADNSRLSSRTTLVVSAAIMFVAAVSTLIIFSTEPEAEREAATRKTAMMVEVTPARQGDFYPTIAAMGTVIPAREVMLQPRIGGQVIEVSANFVPGGRVRQGETLVRLDPADYQNQLRQRRAELTQATAALEIEMGEQAIAERDYRRLGSQNLTEMQRALVLREPQLNAARARVEAAEASVAQAELDLARTRISAPFDAQIVSRAVNLGSQVSPGENLAQLVGLRTYWVEATLPQARLQWLNLDAEEQNVVIRHRTSWPEGETRRGRLQSIMGTLEGQTRMARVLIEVDDPLAVEPENVGRMPLMLGSFVECRIEAEPVRDVVRIEREYVRKNNSAWVMRDNALSIRPLDIVLWDENYAYVKSGLSHGEQVVTTNLSAVSEGAELRLAEAPTDG